MAKRRGIGGTRKAKKKPAPRRRRGTGRVYRRTYVDKATGERRPYKTWSIQYVDRHGRKQREHGMATGGEAERVLRDRLSAKDEGRDSGALIERTMFTDLERMLLDDYAANGHRSIDRLKSGLAHLRGFFRHERAVRITEDRVTAYVGLRRREGAANATINYELATLKRAFRVASRRVGRPPDIKLLRVDNARQGFFEEADFRAVLHELPAYLRPVAVTMYYTGWRASSEILTREWKHVDLAAGWMRLEPGETKTRRGRQFPIDAAPELRATLEEQKRRQEAERAAGRIVPWVFFRVTRSRAGHVRAKPIKYFRIAWVMACANAGFGQIVRDQEGRIVKRSATRIPHDFRRTAVRNLERAGVPRSSAMAMVGHKTESVYRRYAISDEVSLLEGAAKMAAWISGRVKAHDPAK